MASRRLEKHLNVNFEKFLLQQDFTKLLVTNHNMNDFYNENLLLEWVVLSGLEDFYKKSM